MYPNIGLPPSFRGGSHVSWTDDCVCSEELRFTGGLGLSGMAEGLGTCKFIEWQFIKTWNDPNNVIRTSLWPMWAQSWLLQFCSFIIFYLIGSIWIHRCNSLVSCSVYFLLKFCYDLTYWISNLDKGCGCTWFPNSNSVLGSDPEAVLLSFNHISDRCWQVLSSYGHGSVPPDRSLVPQFNHIVCDFSTSIVLWWLPRQRDTKSIHISDGDIQWRAGNIWMSPRKKHTWI